VIRCAEVEFIRRSGRVPPSFTRHRACAERVGRATSVDAVTDVSPDPTTPPDPVDLDAVDLDAIDLDAIERDLAAVERALERLSDGIYWTDEVTGEPIPDHVLVADPTARRA
jgi:RNA polymerase-binding transcription factor DksA